MHCQLIALFPGVSITNEDFSKCGFQGGLTSYLGTWQLCVMSCQRMHGRR